MNESVATNRMRARIPGAPIALAALLCFAGCSGEPPPGPGGEKAEEKVEGASGPTAAKKGYDPGADPLVNPKSLFAPAPEDPAAIATDETLVRTLRGSPTTLNPIFFSSGVEGEVEDTLYDGLFTFDPNMQWRVNEAVVESYEESEDKLTATAVLREGLKWHDGAPFTAEDVRFSWQVILDERVPCPAVKSGTDQVADVVVVDARTVRFVHKEALPTNRWNILFPVLPKHVFGNPAEMEKDPTLSNSDYYNEHNRTKVVANGPYRLVEWVANDRIVVERWEEYPGPKPHFKRIVFKIQEDATVALQLFRSGGADEIELRPQQFAKETSDPDFGKVGVKGFAPEWSFSYVGWNMDGSNPFFSDVLVRRAMAHAANIEKMIDVIGFNLVTQARGIYHPDAPMYNKTIELFAFDLKKAGALLDEAGWKISDEDGWRHKTIDGKDVKFSFELLIPAGSQTGPQMAAIFAEDLKKIGVELKTRLLEWVAFQEQTHNHEFQAQTARWGTGTDPDTGWNLWHSTEYEGGRNYGGYNNPRVDELFAQGRREFDPDKRNAIYAEIQKLVYEDQPYLFLWNGSTTWAFHKRLRGVGFSPRGVFGFDPSYKSWWVAKGEAMRPL